MGEKSNNNDVPKIEKPSFTIEAFLRKAKIDENDISRYRHFLEKWGLKSEDRLQLLTREELNLFAKEYKSEQKDFNLTPSDAALIAETAKSVAGKRKLEEKDENEEPPKKKMVPLFVEKFTAFWDALSKAEEKDGVLCLPGNNFWRGDERLGSSLVVRECYKDLWNLVHQRYQNQKYGGIAILGNPGIGKTVFQNYMLWQLRKIGTTVVLKTRGKSEYFLLSQNGAYFATMEDYEIANALHTKGTWFLVDGESPSYEVSFTVLTSSPRKDNYKEFLKQIGVSSLWMPMWSWDELQKLHTLQYPNINVNDLISLYEKWGGVPRYVLEKANDTGAQLELDNAIAACDLDAVTRCVGEFDASETVSHKIIHNIVDKDYIHRHIDWASEYVAKKIFDVYMITKEQQLKAFLVSSGGIGPYGSLRGIMLKLMDTKYYNKADLSR